MMCFIGYSGYTIRHPCGTLEASFRNPEEVRRCLQTEALWPPGTYEVAEPGETPEHAPGRWGVAVKREDGSVELIPNAPA